MSSIDLIRYVAVPVIVAIIGAAGYVVSKKAQKGSRENDLIDQLQEQLNRADERADKQDQRMARIEEEQRATKRREHTLVNYVHQLRQDIVDRREPPPRDWPEGLYQ